MHLSISHDRNDESPEPTAAWFRSLTIEERMDLFCKWTNLILDANPGIPDADDARSPSMRILVVSKP
ncbi:MAG: hypothetical protein DCC65_18390 [Planctomycetota bacterium]|nr:MAG: hypothetical protein DCC65_18390 [Planctomycetota bacterium]